MRATGGCEQSLRGVEKEKAFSWMGHKRFIRKITSEPGPEIENQAETGGKEREPHVLGSGHEAGRGALAEYQSGCRAGLLGGHEREAHGLPGGVPERQAEGPSLDLVSKLNGDTE